MKLFFKCKEESEDQTKPDPNLFIPLTYLFEVPLLGHNWSTNINPDPSQNKQAPITGFNNGYFRDEGQSPPDFVVD